MNKLKISYIIILIVFIGLNLVLVVYSKKEKKIIQELNKNYQIKCYDEKSTQDFLETYIKFQGKTLELISNNSLRDKICTQKEPSSLLLIKQHVCSTCFDVFLLELEQLRSDSLKILNNLSVVLLNDEDYRINNIVKVFQLKNIPVYVVSVREFILRDTGELPDMSLLLIDRTMQILSFCEFSERYPSVFSFGVTNIDKKYNQMRNGCSN